MPVSTTVVSFHTLAIPTDAFPCLFHSANLAAPLLLLVLLPELHPHPLLHQQEHQQLIHLQLLLLLVQSLLSNKLSMLKSQLPFLNLRVPA